MSYRMAILLGSLLLILALAQCLESFGLLGTPSLSTVQSLGAVVGLVVLGTAGIWAGLGRYREWWIGAIGAPLLLLGVYGLGLELDKHLAARRAGGECRATSFLVYRCVVPGSQTYRTYGAWGVLAFLSSGSAFIVLASRIHRRRQPLARSSTGDGASANLTSGSSRRAPPAAEPQR